MRAEEAAHAHNLLVEVFAEAGLVGLGALGAFLLTWVRSIVRRLERPQAASAPASDAGPAAGPLPLAGGLLLGLLLLAGAGDIYSAEPGRQGHLLAIAVGVPAIALLLERGARHLPGQALAAAALAGASVLLFDGLLSFGLHQPGLLTIVVLLLGCSLALVGRPLPPTPRWKWPAWTAVVCLAGCTLWLLLAKVPGARAADLAREEAQAAHVEGARSVEALREACDAYATACDLYPDHVLTWLDRPDWRPPTASRGAAWPRPPSTRRSPATPITRATTCARPRPPMPWPGRPGSSPPNASASGAAQQAWPATRSRPATPPAS
jgi:hypothetical protein